MAFGMQSLLMKSAAENLAQSTMATTNAAQAQMAVQNLA